MNADKKRPAQPRSVMLGSAPAVFPPDDYRSLVERQRSYLVRYAALQLLDPEAVQDVVQEALLAALAAEASFARRSSLRTWLTGILKHKIIDAIRRRSREFEHFADAANEAGEFDALFREDGRWVEHPSAWDNPGATTVIGITFVVMMLWVGAWAYTDVLAELAQVTSRQLAAGSLLLAALFAGAVTGGLSAGRFRQRRSTFGQLQRAVVRPA